MALDTRSILSRAAAHTGKSQTTEGDMGAKTSKSKSRVYVSILDNVDMASPFTDTQRQEMLGRIRVDRTSETERAAVTEIMHQRGTDSVVQTPHPKTADLYGRRWYTS
ncbi:hypothetical protein PINS_up000922 [Pythium insidiosum]|nr:hypothetical protein PINS_up000922 [Pythium insidiosum]